MDHPHRRLRHLLMAILLISAVFVPALAHEAFLTIEDNLDGTLLIKAHLGDEEAVNTGMIVVRDKNSGQPLSRQTLPPIGGLVIKAPDRPYTVSLDAGDSHTVTVTGPFTLPAPGVSGTCGPECRHHSLSGRDALLILLTAGVLGGAAVLFLAWNRQKETSDPNEPDRGQG